MDHLTEPIPTGEEGQQAHAKHDDDKGSRGLDVGQEGSRAENTHRDHGARDHQLELVVASAEDPPAVGAPEKKRSEPDQTDERTHDQRRDRFHRCRGQVLLDPGRGTCCDDGGTGQDGYIEDECRHHHPAQLARQRYLRAGRMHTGPLS
jgi:N-acetylmuramoyl-L-alanine amidase